MCYHSGAMARPAAPPDARPRVYAALDLVFALVYLGLLLNLPSDRHGLGQVLFCALILSTGGMAAGMLLGGLRGWWLASLGCGVSLLVALALLIMLLASAGFLAGVYGGLGRAASLLSLVIAALVIELVALLPLFQLKYLRTTAGRRAFGAPCT